MRMHFDSIVDARFTPLEVGDMPFDAVGNVINGLCPSWCVILVNRQGSIKFIVLGHLSGCPFFL